MDYSVGITIRLIDRVSAALRSISGSFLASQMPVNALNSSLKGIQKTFASGVVMIGGGMALAAPLVAATRAAEDYQHQINRMTSAGLTHKEMVNSIAAAWKTTGTVITSTSTENLKVISDLRSIFGKTQEAIDHMPTFAKMQGAYSSILDGNLARRSDALTFAAAKAVDMIGKVNSRQEFNDQIGKMFRATEASLGRVTPSDYQTTYKYMRQAKFGLDDIFRYKILPELMLENKGGGGSGTSGGVGPQIAALYRFGVQGIMNKRSAQTLAGMGMIPASSILKTTTSGTTLKGGVLGSDLLAKNPLDWVQKVFIPHLATHFKINSTNTDQLVQASNQVFKGNQLATSLVGELIKKQQQYTRFAGLYDKTDTMDQAYKRGLANDPKINWKALDAAVTNVKTAIGEHIVPVLIPMVNQLAQGLQRASRFLHDHPNFSKALSGITALAAGALVLGGALNIAKAGFSGLGLLVPLLPQVGGALAAAFAPGILITVAAVAGTIALIATNWDRLSKFVKTNSGSFTHIAAEAVRSFDRLGTTLRYLGNTIGSVIEQISIYVSAIPGMQESGQNIQIAALKGLNNLTRKMKVSKETQERDEKFLNSRGLGWALNAIKGVPSAEMNGTTAAMQKVMQKQAPALMHNGVPVKAPGRHISLNPTINIYPQKHHDERKIVAMALDHFSEAIRHATDASSGFGGLSQPMSNYG